MTISKHVLLTDKYLQTFARSYVLPGERKEIWDTQLAAFGVRLTESGVMSFIVRARMPGAKNPTTITLGHYPDITLKEARDRAIDAVRNLKAGKHPQALKAEKLEAERTRRAEAARKKAVVAKAKADSFEAVAERWIAEKVKHFRPGGQYDTQRIVRKELVPAFRKPITQVTSSDVKNVIREIAQRSPSTARQALQWVRSIYEWADEIPAYELAGHNPTLGIKPSKIIPKIKPRQNFLKDHEMRALWAVADALGYPIGSIVKILLLTGLRLNEVAQASWAEFDLEAAEWTVPGERMKNGLPHLVPLTRDMVAILKTIPRGTAGDFVFSKKGGKKPSKLRDDIKAGIDEAMILQIAKDRGIEPAPELLPHWVNHDMRRTIRTGMSKLGIDTEVKEAVLSHAKTGLTKVYELYDYAPEKRAALEKWCDHVRRIVKPSKLRVVA